MIGTVQEIGQTQSGKAKVKVDGNWLFPGRTPIDGLRNGMQIEYATSSFMSRDGKPMFGLESWRPVLQQPVPNPAPKFPQGPTPAAPSNGVAHGGPSDDAEMRFISNCVGQAIAAGTIKEPGDISIWFQAAQAALRPDAPEF